VDAVSFGGCVAFDRGITVEGLRSELFEEGE
jgi:hypothetical protein